MARGRVMAAVAAVASAALTVGSGAPAGAAPGNGGLPDANGYVAVAVSVSGDVSASKRASVRLPPALCWWKPWPGDGVNPDNPEAVKEYYFEELRPWLNGHAAAGQLHVSSESDFDQAIEMQESGNPRTWYQLQVRDDVPTGDPAGRAEILTNAGCSQANDRLYEGMPVMITLRHFPFRTPEPPKIDAETLAEYAYEVMQLEEPTLDWNPKIGAQDNAALLNLPTWLWVDEGGAVGDKAVTATAGDVSVTVTAQSNGISVVSPAGSTECSVAQSRQRYGAGVAPASACLLDFTRASHGMPGGFPVRSSTAWQAEWSSNTGESGTLPGRTIGAVTNIRVAGSQALVTQVD